MLRLNIACGEYKIEGAVNIDMIENDAVKPDLLLDIRKDPFPYKDGEVDEIWMTHGLEHIEFYYWPQMFNEFSRILRPQGKLMISYPEFSEVAKRFVDNTNNNRAFWRATLYGRQLYDSDYHVVPMHSPELKDILETHNFYRVTYRPESEQEPYNTILVAQRDPEPDLRENIIAKELNMFSAAEKGMVDSMLKSGLLEEYAPKTYRVSQKGRVLVNPSGH